MGLQKGRAALGAVFPSRASSPGMGTPRVTQVAPPDPQNKTILLLSPLGRAPAFPMCVLPGNQPGWLWGKPWHHRAVNKVFIFKVYPRGFRTNTRPRTIQLGTKFLQLCLSFPIDDADSALSREGVG